MIKENGQKLINMVTKSLLYMAILEYFDVYHFLLIYLYLKNKKLQTAILLFEKKNRTIKDMHNTYIPFTHNVHIRLVKSDVNCVGRKFKNLIGNQTVIPVNNSHFQETMIIS